MSTSYFIDAIKAPDETFTKMLAVYNACKAADIAPPDEVEDYFDGEPDPTGVRIPITDSDNVKPIESDCYWGYSVKLSGLPKGTTHIQFRMD